ncbi:MAG: hypothetical protein ACLSXN_04845 [Veillonella parvula]|uniref:hypothetical protein n=1 Tax=Veillonella parvula TaxID=29466 RepID=UPI003995888E
MAKTNEEANVVASAANEVSETNTAPAPTFDPETIITSDRFSRYADMLGAVLENREYSVEEVEKLLDRTLSTPIVEVYND